MAFTFFFRDQRVLDSVVQHLALGVLDHNTIRVWDAGCASGEEAYSVAMLFFENLSPWVGGNLRIDATDIEENSDFANTIGSGIYARSLLKNCPYPELLAKYSHPADREGFVEFDEGLRHCIFYQRHDLVSLQSIGSNYNVVVCKNVLMHLAEEQQVAVLKMFYGALSPGGYLALDELQKLPADVVPLFARVLADDKLYRKVEGA